MEMKIGESVYIGKLRERVLQKPDSRLFLSLAEELRKRNRMEEALEILADGVKRNPSFTAGRVTLGKWYFEAGMMEEAMRELLEADAQDSRSIFVHRLLAKIYEGLGSRDEVAGEYRKIASLDPYDEEAALYLKSAEIVPSIPEVEDTPRETILVMETPAVQVIKEPLCEHKPGDDLLKEAEEHIAAGRYRGALAVYDSLLASGVECQAAQRKAELKSLMKMMGKDTDLVVERLNNFSGAVRNRFAPYLSKGRKEEAVVRLRRLLGGVRNKFAQAPLQSPERPHKQTSVV